MGVSTITLRGAVEASVNAVGVGTPHSAEHCCDDGPLVTHPLHRSKPFWPPNYRVLALTFASLAVLYWVLRCFDRLRSGRKSAGTSRALADVNETACLGDHTHKEGGESEDGGSPEPSHEAPHTLPSELPAAQGMETAAANEASAHFPQEWSEADGDAFWQWYPETAGAASAGEPPPQWMQSPQELQLDPLHAGGIYFPTGDLQQSMDEQPGLAAYPLLQRVVDQVSYMHMAAGTDTFYPYSQEPSDQESVLLPFAYPEGPWYQTPHNPKDSAQMQFNHGGLPPHRDGDSAPSDEPPDGGSAAGGLTQSRKVQSLSPSSQDPFGEGYSGPAGDASAAEPSLRWTQHPQELQLDPLHVGDIYFPPGDLHQSMYEPPELAVDQFLQESATQVPYSYWAPYGDTFYPYSQELSDQETVLLPFAYPEGAWHQTPHNPMESAQVQFNKGGLRTHQDGYSTASGGAPDGGSGPRHRFRIGETWKDWEGRGLPPPARQNVINVLDWMHRNAFMCNSVLPFLSTDQGGRLALITLKILTMDLGVLWLVPEDLEPVRQSIGDTLLELVESTTTYQGKDQEENYNIQEVRRMSPLIRQIMLRRDEEKPVPPEKRPARTHSMTGWVRKINLYLARMLWDLPMFAESASPEDFEKVVEQDIKVLNALWDLHKKYITQDKIHRRHVLACQRNSNNWMLFSSREANAEKESKFPAFKEIIEEFEQTVRNAGGIPLIAAGVSETSGDDATIQTYSEVTWPYHPLNIANSQRGVQLGVPIAPQQSRMAFATDQNRHVPSTESISQALSREGWLGDHPPP
ncbi:hypothetical protein EMWEY_00039780 [Eimeria maxima]|uniref:Uncharacterized protein n=1 Tax=Eimeria maxima TaxID=5804 RepID=U6ME25_EIMMA|nr:hypothetical protein EMWEY_00039780 [Eimeria maxima]CDJ61308.1 hypothetical protein EMWEY_00039780 [Eimeria maxima]